MWLSSNKCLVERSGAVCFFRQIISDEDETVSARIGMLDMVVVVVMLPSRSEDDKILDLGIEVCVVADRRVRMAMRLKEQSNTLTKVVGLVASGLGTEVCSANRS